MSFCRFCDNNFHCDFYAYRSRLGYELHVAVVRSGLDPATDPYNVENVLDIPVEEWKKMVGANRGSFAQAGRQPIDLPEAGAKYRFATLEELREGIAGLMEKGFLAPDWLLPSLDKEIAGGARDE